MRILLFFQLVILCALVIFTQCKNINEIYEGTLIIWHETPAHSKRRELLFDKLKRQRWTLKLRDGGRPEDLTDICQYLSNNNGQCIDNIYPVINGEIIEADQSTVLQMVARYGDYLDYIEQDHLLTYQEVQSGVVWNLDRVDASAGVQDGQYKYQHDGTDVNVYVFDTGVRLTHDEFGYQPKFDVTGNYLEQKRSFSRAQSAYSVVEGTWAGEDCEGHGTHVAGVVGGLHFGVAKNATIHGVKVLNCDGNGRVTDVLRALKWFVNNGEPSSVVVLSIGTTPDVSLDAGVNRVVQYGHHVVVAAGNQNSDACQFSPGRLNSVITVGAVDQNNSRYVANQARRRSPGSNYGSCVDVYAPGADIYSADSLADNAGRRRSGTSQAAPHVAGLVALYLQTNPRATPEQVKQQIVSSSLWGVVADNIQYPTYLDEKQFDTQRLLQRNLVNTQLTRSLSVSPQIINIAKPKPQKQQLTVSKKLFGSRPVRDTAVSSKVTVKVTVPHGLPMNACVSATPSNSQRGWVVPSEQCLQPQVDSQVTQILVFTLVLALDGMVQQVEHNFGHPQEHLLLSLKLINETMPRYQAAIEIVSYLGASIAYPLVAPYLPLAHSHMVQKYAKQQVQRSCNKNVFRSGKHVYYYVYPTTECTATISSCASEVPTRLLIYKLDRFQRSVSLLSCAQQTCANGVYVAVTLKPNQGYVVNLIAHEDAVGVSKLSITCSQGKVSTRLPRWLPAEFPPISSQPSSRSSVTGSSPVLKESMGVLYSVEDQLMPSILPDYKEVVLLGGQQVSRSLLQGTKQNRRQGGKKHRKPKTDNVSKRNGSGKGFEGGYDPLRTTSNHNSGIKSEQSDRVTSSDGSNKPQSLLTSTGPKNGQSNGSGMSETSGTSGTASDNGGSNNSDGDNNDKNNAGKRNNIKSYVWVVVAFGIALFILLCIAALVVCWRYFKAKEPRRSIVNKTVQAGTVPKGDVANSAGQDRNITSKLQESQSMAVEQTCGPLNQQQYAQNDRRVNGQQYSQHEHRLTIQLSPGARVSPPKLSPAASKQARQQYQISPSQNGGQQADRVFVPKQSIEQQNTHTQQHYLPYKQRSQSAPRPSWHRGASRSGQQPNFSEMNNKSLTAVPVSFSQQIRATPGAIDFKQREYPVDRRASSNDALPGRHSAPLVNRPSVINRHIGRQQFDTALSQLPVRTNSQQGRPQPSDMYATSALPAQQHILANQWQSGPHVSVGHYSNEGHRRARSFETDQQGLHQIFYQHYAPHESLPRAGSGPLDRYDQQHTSFNSLAQHDSSIDRRYMRSSHHSDRSKYGVYSRSTSPPYASNPYVSHSGPLCLSHNQQQARQSTTLDERSLRNISDIYQHAGRSGFSEDLRSLKIKNDIGMAQLVAEAGQPFDTNYRSNTQATTLQAPQKAPVITPKQTTAREGLQQGGAQIHQRPRSRSQSNGSQADTRVQGRGSGARRYGSGSTTMRSVAASDASTMGDDLLLPMPPSQGPGVFSIIGLQGQQPKILPGMLNDDMSVASTYRPSKPSNVQATSQTRLARAGQSRAVGTSNRQLDKKVAQDSEISGTSGSGSGQYEQHWKSLVQAGQELSDVLLQLRQTNSRLGTQGSSTAAPKHTSNTTEASSGQNEEQVARKAAGMLLEQAVGLAGLKQDQPSNRKPQPSTSVQQAGRQIPGIRGSKPKATSPAQGDALGQESNVHARSIAYASRADSSSKNDSNLKVPQQPNITNTSTDNGHNQRTVPRVLRHTASSGAKARVAVRGNGLASTATGTSSGGYTAQINGNVETFSPPVLPGSSSHSLSAQGKASPMQRPTLPSYTTKQDCILQAPSPKKRQHGSKSSSNDISQSTKAVDRDTDSMTINRREESSHYGENYKHTSDTSPAMMKDKFNVSHQYSTKQSASSIAANQGQTSNQIVRKIISDEAATVEQSTSGNPSPSMQYLSLNPSPVQQPRTPPRLVSPPKSKHINTPSSPAQQSSMEPPAGQTMGYLSEGAHEEQVPGNAESGSMVVTNANLFASPQLSPSPTVSNPKSPQLSDRQSCNNVYKGFVQYCINPNDTPTSSAAKSSSGNARSTKQDAVNSMQTLSGSSSPHNQQRQLATSQTSLTGQPVKLTRIQDSDSGTGAHTQQRSHSSGSKHYSGSSAAVRSIGSTTGGSPGAGAQRMLSVSPARTPREMASELQQQIKAQYAAWQTHAQTGSSAGGASLVPNQRSSRETPIRSAQTYTSVNSMSSRHRRTSAHSTGQQSGASQRPYVPPLDLTRAKTIKQLENAMMADMQQQKLAEKMNAKQKTSQKKYVKSSSVSSSSKHGNVQYELVNQNSIAAQHGSATNIFDLHSQSKMEANQNQSLHARKNNTVFSSTEDVDVFQDARETYTEDSTRA